MKRFSVLLIVLLVSLLGATGIGTGTSVAHADSGKINWSKTCSANGDLMAPSHGACVQAFQSVNAFTSVCASLPFTTPTTLTFYDSNDILVAGPFVITNMGSCMSTFALVKGTNWATVHIEPPPAP